MRSSSLVGLVYITKAFLQYAIVHHKPGAVVVWAVIRPGQRINRCMETATLNHDLGNRRWLVKFSFSCADDRQATIVQELGLLAHEVVRLWIDVITPGACVLEPPGTPVGQVAFPSRSSARHFRQSWGGKLLDGHRE